MSINILCITMVEKIEMISQIVLALTAVIMAWLAYKTYLRAPLQEPTKAVTEKDKNYTEDMVIFDTSRQRTILCIDKINKLLKCHLFNKKENKGQDQWSISAEEVKEIINTSDIYINPNYKPNTGTFSIGQHRNWLYSKKLFPEPDYLKGEIINLLKKLEKV